MDSDMVRALAQAGETFTVEFKSERNGPLHDNSLVEAVICLANGDGGLLLLGVEDDGAITGTQRSPHQVCALISSKSMPSFRPAVHRVEIDGVHVLIVEVVNATTLMSTVNSVYKRRALDVHGKPACVNIAPHDILTARIQHGEVDFSTLPVPEATWGDLDPLEFHRLRRLIEESGGSGDRTLVELGDSDIAAALGVVGSRDPEHATIFMGALLLFGKQESLRRLVPNHEAAFQVLTGSAVRMNDFFRWPLLRLAEDFLRQFQFRNTEEEMDFGLQRVALPEYSEIAFREALANAFIHRDYTRQGAVHVQWHDEDLVISSPGGFPEGVRLDNILVTPPHPRNPMLADAFKRAGLVERTGRGINRMFEEQLRFGRSAPEYGRSNESVVVAVLPGGPANPAVTRFVLEQDRSRQSLQLSDLQLINELAREREITTADAARLTQTTEEQSRRLLLRMVERGLIEARGSGRNRVYHLSAAVYRQLGDAAGYVHMRGFDPFQHEQMVLQYVHANGEIRNAQAADLCHITSRQANVLLTRLVRERKLTKRGEKRGTYYVLPTDEAD